MTTPLHSWYHSWIAAIRIARRDAWRAKGRSALVLAMIALPIVGVSAVDLTTRSAALTVDETLSRRIGTADAMFSNSDMGVPVYQKPNGESFAPVGGYSSWDPSARDDGKDPSRPPSRRAPGP